MRYIPLELLFGDPEVQKVRISPDGRWLAMIRPYRGHSNVWIAPVATGRARPLTTVKGRGIQDYVWSYDGRHLLTIQDTDGDENWRICSISIPDGTPRLLTPGMQVQARIVAISPHHPTRVMVALNDRDPRWHDLYQVDLETGRLERVMENHIAATEWLVDEYLQLRGAYRMLPDGGAEVRIWQGGQWKVLLRWGVENVLSTLPIAVRGARLYLRSTLQSNTAQLVAVSLDSRHQTVLASHPKYDVGIAVREEPLIFAPGALSPLAVAITGTTQDWIVLDDTYRSTFELLREKAAGRQFYVINQDLRGRLWVVAIEGDQQSIRYHLFDRDSGEVRLLYRSRPKLERYELHVREPFRFRARDGLEVEGYLTTPRNPSNSSPLVAYIHGGPWHRDYWGFEPIVQWLANRGFAIIQVNFRGSIGYGRDFIEKSIKEWGGKMLDDVVDGVDDLLAQGLADPSRVSVLGGSFGGYSTLAALAFYPDRFKSGVDIVGPSNLFTFLDSLPPYWQSYRTMLYHYVGHPQNDAELLRQRSPFFHVKMMRAPLLVAQGANDPRVKRQESLQIVESLRRRGHPVQYVEYANEGHGFVVPANRLDFFRKAEQFLLEYGR